MSIGLLASAPSCAASTDGGLARRAGPRSRRRRGNDGTAPARVVASAPAAAAKRAAAERVGASSDRHGERAAERVAGAGGVDRSDGEWWDPAVAVRCVDLDPLAAQRRDHGLDTDVEAAGRRRRAASRSCSLGITIVHRPSSSSGSVTARCRIEDRHSAAGTGLARRHRRRRPSGSPAGRGPRWRRGGERGAARRWPPGRRRSSSRRHRRR